MKVYLLHLGNEFGWEEKFLPTECHVILQNPFFHFALS